VLFEGQMGIAFIQEALAAQQITHAHIICVECSEETRTARLTHDRQQPELANEGIMAGVDTCTPKRLRQDTKSWTQPGSP